MRFPRPEKCILVVLQALFYRALSRLPFTVENH